MGASHTVGREAGFCDFFIRGIHLEIGANDSVLKKRRPVSCVYPPRLPSIRVFT